MKHIGRNIIFLIIAVLIVAIWYVVNESNKLSVLDSFIPEKLVTLKNVHMSGIEPTNEAWEIFAEEAWTGRNKSITTLDHVTNAIIESGGRIKVKDLKAKRLKINKNKDIEIYKSVSGETDQYLSAQIDFGAASKPPKKAIKFSFLTADYIKFNPDKKSALITGNIMILKDKLVVSAESIMLDLDKNVATFEGKGSFLKKGTKLSANAGTLFLDKDIVNMNGSIEVVQKSRKATSDRAIYDDNKRTITMTSNVRVVIEKPKNIIKKEIASKYKTTEGKEALSTRTIITCKKLIANTENDNCLTYGNVHVLQKNKEAKSDQAEYFQDKEMIVMTGNAYLRKNSDWVKANKIIVYVDKEIFEATGQVETTFKVKKGSGR